MIFLPQFIPSFLGWVRPPFVRVIFDLSLLCEDMEQEGNGPLDSRAMVMISYTKLGHIFEIRSPNYPASHKHIAEALFQMSSKSKQTDLSKQTADISKIYKFNINTLCIMSVSMSKNKTDRVRSNS